MRSQMCWARRPLPHAHLGVQRLIRKPDLAYPAQDAPESTPTSATLQWAQTYAFGSSQRLMDAAIRGVVDALERPVGTAVTIDSHHNCARRGRHHATDQWFAPPARARCRRHAGALRSLSQGAATERTTLVRQHGLCATGGSNVVVMMDDIDAFCRTQ